MDAVTSKRQKKMSQQQEKRVAEDLGGRTVAGSGAGRTSGGGDVRKRFEIRAECKVTEKNYFVLQFTDLQKIWRQAIGGGLERPVMQVRFAVPRALAQEFAITPSTHGVVTLSTERKRLRLTLSDLQLKLLDTPVITVSINNSVWDIRYWTTFLKELEQERANDQHNS